MECRKFYSRGRSLAEKYRDQPFQIVGVNIGDELLEAKTVFRYEELDWPCFYLGYDYTFPDLYGVEGYPTMIVLDKDMRIRSVSVEVDLKTIAALLETDVSQK